MRLNKSKNKGNAILIVVVIILGLIIAAAYVFNSGTPAPTPAGTPAPVAAPVLAPDVLQEALDIYDRFVEERSVWDAAVALVAASDPSAPNCREFRLLYSRITVVVGDFENHPGADPATVARVNALWAEMKAWIEKECP